MKKVEVNLRFVVSPKEMHVLNDPLSIFLAFVVIVIMLCKISIDSGESRNTNLVYPVA